VRTTRPPSGRESSRRPARKRFGQHFLEPAWIDKVVRVIDAAPGEDFIEIGPGRGQLTHPLARVAAHVVAFEIDRDLAAALKADAPVNVTVVQGDFLEASHERIRGALGSSARPSALRVVGNLPYNVASPILFKLIELLDQGLPIVDATVMVQREVADRLLAQPGTRDYGVLTVLVRHRAAVTRLLDLPPGAFRPVPRVRSTVVRIRLHAAEPAPRDRTHFKAMVKELFSHRRKMVSNAIAPHVASRGLDPALLLQRAGIDGRRRPETLEIADLVRLSDAAVREN
jgi:16S rRNA (adenine1518-N6/adenine1519-N6)-dimethyltransferase